LLSQFGLINPPKIFSKIAVFFGELLKIPLKKPEFAIASEAILLAMKRLLAACGVTDPFFSGLTQAIGIFIYHYGKGTFNRLPDRTCSG